LTKGEKKKTQENQTLETKGYAKMKAVGQWVKKKLSTADWQKKEVACTRGWSLRGPE